MAKAKTSQRGNTSRPERICTRATWVRCVESESLGANWCSAVFCRGWRLGKTQAERVCVQVEGFGRRQKCNQHHSLYTRHTPRRRRQVCWIVHFTISAVQPTRPLDRHRHRRQRLRVHQQRPAGCALLHSSIHRRRHRQTIPRPRHGRPTSKEQVARHIPAASRATALLEVV